MKGAGTLILMACSGKKLPRPAQPKDLYLGPMWQTLRKYRGLIPWGNVFVISGRFGFIEAENFIQTYDEKLTPEKADAMIAQGIDRNTAADRGKFTGFGLKVADVIRPSQHRGKASYTRVIIAGAGNYRRVFESYIPELKVAGIIATDAEVSQVEGGIGEQRQQLGQWLQKANGIVPNSVLPAVPNSAKVFRRV